MSDPSKPDSIHTSCRSESSNKSLVVLDKVTICWKHLWQFQNKYVQLLTFVLIIIWTKLNTTLHYLSNTRQQNGNILHIAYYYHIFNVFQAVIRSCFSLQCWQWPLAHYTIIYHRINMKRIQQSHAVPNIIYTGWHCESECRHTCIEPEDMGICFWEERHSQCIVFHIIEQNPKPQVTV